MNDQQYNGTLLLILVVCLAVIFLALTSCRTTHDVEVVQEHDTLTIHHTDTVREVKLQTVRDTTHLKEVHTITLGAAGDTLKENHYFYHTEKTIVVDSTDRYQSKVDSLQRIIDSQKDKQTTIEKRPSWWDRFKGRVALILALCALVALAWYSFKDRIKKALRR